MDYFCYISQSKVDQMLASMEEAETVELSEQTTSSNDRTASAGLSNILAVLKADISYGRSDMFQRSRTMKIGYVQKLKRVLKRIQPNIILFEWIVGSAARQGQTFYFHRGQFVLDAIDDRNLIATLATASGASRLLLDCSLRHFSDQPVKDEQVHITSTNYRFFEKKMSLTLEAVFSISGREEGAFVGSPLYLKMQPIEGFVL